MKFWDVDLNTILLAAASVGGSGVAVRSRKRQQKIHDLVNGTANALENELATRTVERDQAEHQLLPEVSDRQGVLDAARVPGVVSGEPSPTTGDGP